MRTRSLSPRWAVLQSVAALALVATGLFAMATAAGASTRPVYVKVRYRDLLKTSHVRFSDIGGNCDKDKKFPNYDITSAYTHTPNGDITFSSYDANTFDLFTSKATGSCASQGTNAQFRIEVTGATTAKAWTNINVTQSGAGSSFRVGCYGQNNLTCTDGGQTETRGYQGVHVEVTIGPIVKKGGPSGYGFCAPEGGTCTASYGATVAFGAGSTYVHRGISTLPRTVHGQVYVRCNSTFFGSDPVPNVKKACFKT